MPHGCFALSSPCSSALSRLVYMIEAKAYQSTYECSCPSCVERDSPRGCQCFSVRLKQNVDYIVRCSNSRGGAGLKQTYQDLRGQLGRREYQVCLSRHISMVYCVCLLQQHPETEWADSAGLMYTEIFLQHTKDFQNRINTVQICKNPKNVKVGQVSLRNRLKIHFLLYSMECS